MLIKQWDLDFILEHGNSLQTVAPWYRHKHAGVAIPLRKYEKHIRVICVDVHFALSIIQNETIKTGK